MKADIHPLLKKQKGFREDVTLLQANACTSISIWADRASAESYDATTYPEVLKRLASVVEGEPSTETYESVLTLGRTRRAATVTRASGAAQAI